MNSVPGRVSVLVSFVVLGLIIGICGAFLQAHRWIPELFGRYLVIPWGTVLLLVVLVLVTRMATVATGTRWGAWLFVTGWLASTVLLSADSPSGDLAISSGGRQLVYLFGGIIVCTATATFPPRLGRGTKSQLPASIS